MKAKAVKIFIFCLFFMPVALFAAPTQYDFIRGDANNDGSIDISDPVYTLFYLFRAGIKPPPDIDALDANDDGRIDIADAIYLLTYLFRSGPAPSAPFPTPGLDPTPDNIDNAPPQSAITINNGGQYTNTPNITLSFTATDEHPVTQMQFSNDNTTWVTPEDYAATKSWTLATGDGERAVYAKFKDSLGNWSQAVSAAIILDTAPPKLNVTSPQENEVIYP